MLFYKEYYLDFLPQTTAPAAHAIAANGKSDNVTPVFSVVAATLTIAIGENDVKVAVTFPSATASGVMRSQRPADFS